MKKTFVKVAVATTLSLSLGLTTTNYSFAEKEGEIRNVVENNGLWSYEEYGVVVKNSNGTIEYGWLPKVSLTKPETQTETQTTKPETQTETSSTDTDSASLVNNPYNGTISLETLKKYTANKNNAAATTKKDEKVLPKTSAVK